jgi:hypothetical protein
MTSARRYAPKVWTPTTLKVVSAIDMVRWELSLYDLD